MGLRAAVKRLLKTAAPDDHALSEQERHKASEGFFDERAKALGPDAYDHVDIERQFKRP